jgi:beta-1,4-mannosyl-glycoprotein beta-1,4-N-acetylglucosaminyltransferase
MKDGTASKHYLQVRSAQPPMLGAESFDRQVQLDADPQTPWANEALMRDTLSRIIHEPEIGVHLGDLIVMSDIDEIPSKAALLLAKTCKIPDWLHLSMTNYMYSFEFPLNDNGYWRASIVTATSDVAYSHQRHSDDLLQSAGWHCSWCFDTIEQFKIKMKVVSILVNASGILRFVLKGYSHKDRLTSDSQLASEEIQRKICGGLDIFDMYPVKLIY